MKILDTLQKGDDPMDNAMDRHLDSEAMDVLLLSGGAALVVLGAGLLLSNSAIRQSAKAALGTLMPDLEGPFKAGIRGVLPDVERYLKLKGM
jgi:hypothetical protein